MSELKLYLVRSRIDNESYFSGNRMIPNWSDHLTTIFGSYEVAKEIAEDNNGQPAAFVEEPEKVAVSESIGGAIDTFINADTYVQAAAALNYLFSSRKKKDFKRIMKAIRNGYTVANEKKYRLPVPKSWCGDNDHYWRKESDGTLTWGILSGRAEDFEFTKDEIGKFELQDYEKEEVTDDEQ